MENKIKPKITKKNIKPLLDQNIDEEEKIENYIEVDFKGSRKEYFENKRKLPIKVGEYVIVNYDNGDDMGTVNAIINRKIKKNVVLSGSILRKGNSIDIRRLNENRKFEDKILIEARVQAKKHDLDMKFIDIEYKFDRKKLVFYFTADGRVDFRELVRTFASEYRTRIELKQIGVRDEAQRTGGIGICGRELCCSKFLNNFCSINVAMAREQNLFIKPEKFSGACGKLMCCLKYEHDFYKDFKEGIPDVGSVLVKNHTKITIRNVDVFNDVISLSYSTGESVKMNKKDFLTFLKKIPEKNIYKTREEAYLDSGKEQESKKVPTNTLVQKIVDIKKKKHEQKNKVEKSYENMDEKKYEKKMKNNRPAKKKYYKK